MRTVGIILSILAVIALLTWGVVKMNSPWAITIRQAFKTLSRITLVDSGKVRELEANVKYLEFERDSILRLQREVLNENKELVESVTERDVRIARLTRDLDRTTGQLADLWKKNSTRPPTETVLTHDALTSGNTYPSSALREDGWVETDVNRMAEANFKIEKGIVLEEQNETLRDINETLNANNRDLEKMNSNLIVALDQERLITQTYMKERDEFKELYENSEGKTTKKLLVAYTIVAVEAIIIGLMISGGAAN